jgi:dTDP-4-amino-4,6-dideoxygalactose transaminase
MVGLIPSEHWEYRVGDIMHGMAAALSPRGKSFMLHIPEIGDCIPARSARSAMVAALKALDLPSGARIGVPLYCCPVVFKAIREAGCTARFIDVDYSTYCMSPEDLSAKGAQVDAIMAVHMFGNLCDMAKLKEAAEGKPIIEDCAQALGSKYDGRMAGMHGTIAAFSFRSGKYLSVGEGGALYSGDADIRARLSQFVSAMPEPDRTEECLHVATTYIRSVLRRRPLYGPLGYRIWSTYNKNTDFTAKSPIVMCQSYHSDLAIAKKRIPLLDSAIDRQRYHADYYSRSLRLNRGMLCTEKPGTFYNRYLYPITFPAPEQRDFIANYLFKNRIGAIMPYRDIVDIAATYYGYQGDCPVAEQVSRRILVIPSNYSLKNEEIQRIAQCVNEGWEKIANHGRDDELCCDTAGDAVAG